jgi:hypothetical protein
MQARPLLELASPQITQILTDNFEGLMAKNVC